MLYTGWNNYEFNNHIASEAKNDDNGDVIILHIYSQGENSSDWSWGRDDRRRKKKILSLLWHLGSISLWKSWIAFLKKHQNLIGFILSIVIIIYSSISYLLFVTYQVPLPFYLVDVLLSILSIFLFFFYRKSAVRYFYTVDLIVLLTNIVLITSLLSQI